MLLIPLRGAATSALVPDVAEQAAVAEPRTARNAVFLEMGGSGLFLSVNYDRMLSDYFSLRVGIGGIVVEGDRALTFPILFNLLLGPPSDKLEIGAGISLLGPGAATFIALAVGYRYAPTKPGPSFRVGATPFVFLTPDRQQKRVIFAPWAGVSLGVQF
jgi:hypothetical protein